MYAINIHTPKIIINIIITTNLHFSTHLHKGITNICLTTKAHFVLTWPYVKAPTSCIYYRPFAISYPWLF